MTIEIAPKAPAPHKSGGADANASKTKQQSGTQSADKSANKSANATASVDKSAGKSSADGAAAAGDGGFLAILSALGESPAQSAGDGDAQGMLAAADLWAEDASAGTDASANNAASLWAPGGPVVLPSDAAAAARNDSDPAKAALAAAMAGGKTARPLGFEDAGEAAQSGTSRLLQRLHGNSVGAAKGQGLADTATQQGKDIDGAEGSTGASVSGAATAKGEQPPAFDLKMFAAMQEARGSQGAKAPEILVPANLSGVEKRASERTEAARPNADPTYGGAPVGTSGNEFSASGSADVAPAPDMQAAEQVKYWISQDVQNAELKLDGLGYKPVEVSISINGNEAHVAFRSDEVQTRGVLESAGMHLKDMLAREGLLLSGVSVGTSGANDGGGNERKPRQGVKQGLVSSAPLGGVETAKTPRGITGRSLDLFV